MYSAQFYSYIYLLIVSIPTLLCAVDYFARDAAWEGEPYKPRNLTLLLVVCLVLFIGLRPVGADLFGDSASYLFFYEGKYKDVPFEFDWEGNLIFDNLLIFFGAYDLGIHSFFLLCAALYFGTAYVGIKRLFPNHLLAVYLVFLAAFSTFSYGTNGIKAGIAASFFIMAVSYYKQWKLCIPLVLLSYGFHHAMRVPIAAYFLTLIFKNPKLYFLGWLVCLLIVVGHITYIQTLIAKVTGSAGEDYLSGMRVYDNPTDRGGFRADFIVYSLPPIWVGYIAIFKRKVTSVIYTQLLCIYLTTNALWLVCMHALFSNRIAYLSWFLYPIVLVYPFLLPEYGEKRYQSFTLVMLAHLGFTVFMSLFYYA